MNKILLLGSGAFSLALLSVLEKKATNQITLWSPDKTFKLKRKNVLLTYDLEPALIKNDYIFVLTSSKYLTDLLKKILNVNLKEKILFIGTKGLLEENPYFMSDYLESKGISYSLFGGPNLAEELLHSSPTTISFASNYPDAEEKIKNLFPFWIKQITVKKAHSLELCNVLKNIYAIGSGMIYKTYPYSNTHYSYVNEVIKELKRILNDDMYPFLGDLLLTCSMMKSRNFTYGFLFDNVKKRTKFLENNTVEGLMNLEFVKQILEKENISAPLFFSIYKSLKTGKIDEKLKEVIFAS